MNISRRQTGFSLIELMIALLLGLILSAGIIRILVSSQVTERLNRAMSSVQESGRFIVTRLRNDLLMTGRYDAQDPNLAKTVDAVQEAAFVQNHPVLLPGDFTASPTLGSKQGAAGASDTLVVGYQGTEDCRGYKLGYQPNEQFYVVNEYYLDGNQLKCRGFDGRVLRGQQAATGNNGDAAFTLLDDVYGFQVEYGLSQASLGAITDTRAVTWVTADQLSAQLTAGAQVVAVHIALLLKGDGEVDINPLPTFKLLNEAPVTAPDHGLYKQFETTISFRNVKNFLGNRK